MNYAHGILLALIVAINGANLALSVIVAAMREDVENRKREVAELRSRWRMAKVVVMVSGEALRIGEPVYIGADGRAYGVRGGRSH